MNLRILIVDDEKPARTKTIRFLRKLYPNAELLEAGDGAEAVKTIQSRKPDLVMLDIQMPGKNGFDVIREIGIEAMPPVVFVTAFDQYAVQAFEVQAVDYLLKPFDFNRLKTALERAFSEIEKPAAYKEALDQLLKKLDKTQYYESRLPIKSNERVFFVNTDDIRWIEAQGKYAQIHTKEADHLIRKPLQTLENQLDPKQFCRI